MMEAGRERKREVYSEDGNLERIIKMYDRKNLKYIIEDDLYFSLLKGNGIYCWNNATDNDPVDISGKTVCPVFMDIQTEEEFFVKRIYWDRYIRQYMRGILFPPKVDNVIWPVDIVSLEGRQISVNYVENTFGIQTNDMEKGSVKDNILLFPYKNYAISKTVKDELHDVKKLNWKNPRVRELIVNIVEAFQKINKEKYLCLDFDFSHLYIRNDKSIMFAYSNLIVRKPYKKSDMHPDESNELRKGEYPYEFAEPALVQGTIKYADWNMQNYSLTAMLFYLMIGRYAYEGPLMIGLTDNNEVEHEHRFEVYHKNPVFIFDPNDFSNHLGEFAADQRTIDLWEELPEKIRKLFIKTLVQDNAERKDTISNPTPEEWMECLALLK